MRSFLLASLGFLAVGAVPLVLLREIGAALDPLLPSERERRTYLEQRLEAIEALGVGNSHGRAIRFGPLGVPGFHLWTNGQDVFETEVLLRAYVPRLPRLRTVLLPVGWTTFALDNRELPAARREFYAVQPGWRPVDGDLRNLVTGKLAWLVRDDQWEGVFEALWPWDLAEGSRPAEARRFREAPAFSEPDGLTTFTLSPKLVGRYRPLSPEDPTARLRDDYYLSPALMPRVARRQAAAQLETGARMLAAAPDTPERALAALGRCAAYLREQGIRLILFRAPVRAEFVAAFGPQAIERSRRLFERLEAEQGVVAHDFTHDPAICDEPRYFFDAHHLNRAGAEAFSRLRLRPLLEAP